MSIVERLTWHEERESECYIYILVKVPLYTQYYGKYSTWAWSLDKYIATCVYRVLFPVCASSRSRWHLDGHSQASASICVYWRFFDHLWIGVGVASLATFCLFLRVFTVT